MSDPAPQTSPKPAPENRPKRRWFRFFFIVLLLLGVGIYFLPQIVASTALKNHLAEAVKGDMPGTIEIGSADLGWTNTITLKDIKLKPDQNSESILTIAAIESDKSLLDLFSLGDQGLTLTIKAPELNLIVTEQGTNVDELLPELPAGNKNATGFNPVGELKKLEVLIKKLPIGTLTLTDGIIRIDDQPNQSKYSIEGIKTVLKRTNSPKAVGLDLTGNVLIPNQEPQAISAKGLVNTTTQQGSLTTEFPKMTSGLIMPLIESSLPGWKLKSSGVKPGLSLSWDLSTAKPSVDLDATLTLDQATIANEELFPKQRLYFEKGAMLVKSHPTQDLAAWDLQADVALESPTLYQMKANPQGVVEPEVLWQEKTPFAILTGVFNTKADQFQISRAEINSQAAAGTLAGQVKEISRLAVVDLKGSLTIDFQKFSPVLLGLDGQSVQLGKFTTDDIEIKGPLFAAKSQPATPPQQENPKAENNAPVFDYNSQTSEADPAKPIVPIELTGQSTISWDQAYAYGIYSQEGKIKTELTKGIVKATPISVPINGGQWLAPVNVDLRATPAVVTVPQAKVFNNIQFTEQMARLWLKYVNPLVADSTGIEGRFSLALTQAIIPLGHMHLAAIQGHLDVHQGRVGPGPLVQQVMSPAGLIGSFAPGLSSIGEAKSNWMEMQTQSVPFAMQKGRVYHQNFRYKIGDALLTTAGSVGLDTTLDLLIDMPLPEKWKTDKPVLAALAGNGMKIPIRGTLGRPQPDLSAVGQQGKDFGMKAADGLINELINPGSGGEGSSDLGNLINGLIERRKKKKEGK